jgi:hypothetical protein
MCLALGRRESSSGLTFVALSRVKELNNLIFIETLDYSRVKKLGGKQLQLRPCDGRTELVVDIMNPLYYKRRRECKGEP